MPAPINDNIIAQCNDYKIKCYDTNNILKSIKEHKNIIVVDIHKNDILLEYNKPMHIFNNGYKLCGIPEEFLTLAHTYIQIKSRKSINVVAARSIIFINIVLVIAQQKFILIFTNQSNHYTDIFYRDLICVVVRE